MVWVNLEEEKVFQSFPFGKETYLGGIIKKTRLVDRKPDNIRIEQIISALIWAFFGGASLLDVRSQAVNIKEIMQTWENDENLNFGPRNFFL